MGSFRGDFAGRCSYALQRLVDGTARRALARGTCVWYRPERRGARRRGRGVRLYRAGDHHFRYSPLSPLVELADVWCQIEIPAIGPFDSSVPVVAMCELLVAGVAKALQDDATDRIDRIEAVWKDTEVFL